MYYQPISVAPESLFAQPIAEQIWQAKYQYKTNGRIVDNTVKHTWLRVANTLASRESGHKRARWGAAFYRAMVDFRLLPSGRILAGCGTNRNVTLFNTFVMRTVPDSVDGIMDTIKDAALTMQMGGGIGFDFSTVRPKGTTVRGLECPAAGPLAAMDICDSVCRMLVSGTGRGAMMATMRCDHPDIEDFVTAKSDPTRLRNFNMSVMISDAFVEAMRADRGWDLTWQGEVVRSIRARDLWQRIMRQTYDAAEPGVLFIDRINACNPLRHIEEIAATNSCAEQPLPPNGACPLASINLARLVVDPFGPNARLDLEELRQLTATAVRMLDNTIDISKFAVEAQREEAATKRRVGVGVTGVADALIMIGARYGSDRGAELLGHWLRTVQNAAYMASAELAAERGTFARYDGERHMEHEMIGRLDPEVRDAIARHGLRNACLTTIAPTGTTSMYAGNVSSGIEPVFSTSYRRKITGPDGIRGEEEVVDYAVAVYRRLFGEDAALTDAFVTAMTLTPLDHVRMQAAAQRWVDSAISKTVNCPENISFEDFEGVYLAAFDAGCKGCTTYRPNSVTGSVLSA